MRFRLIFSNFRIHFVAVLFSLIGTVQAQNPAALPDEEDYTWWYATLFALIAALAAALVMWSKKKKAAKLETSKTVKNRSALAADSDLTFDADKEIEWMRRNRKTLSRDRRKSGSRSVSAAAANHADPVKEVPPPLNIDLLNAVAPPVFEFERIETAAPVEPLPLSNDEDLLNAIEQSQDEYEEDEAIRELALRILAAFRTRNSVEALSQIAIYDLSSGIRSKAVLILSDFDHESAFEAILLACADPTREVRAAAARAFSRLSFDRADAWTRIIETREQGRMIHAARAAIEGGFVERSFDRLTHRDKKYAYEAFTLVALLIKAGETQQILETLGSSRDVQIKRAIVHVLAVVRDENALSALYNLLEDKDLPAELRKDIDEAVSQSNPATA